MKQLQPFKSRGHENRDDRTKITSDRWSSLLIEESSQEMYKTKRLYVIVFISFYLLWILCLHSVPYNSKFAAFGTSSLYVPREKIEKHYNIVAIKSNTRNSKYNQTHDRNFRMFKF